MEGSSYERGKPNRYRAAAALLALAACASEPTGPAKPIESSDVWFVSTHGQVMLEDRSPLANAFVHAMWFDDSECDKGLIDDATARTDAQGQFSIVLEGRERDGCLGVSVTPEPASGLVWSYTAVQVDELYYNDFESNFTLEWLIPAASASAAGHRVP